MIFGVLRVLNGVPKGGIPKSQVKPTPVHKPVAVMILVISIIVIGVMMASGLSIVLTTACIIGFSALILGSLFVGGVQEASKSQTRLRDMPTLRIPPSPAQMRARADQLEQVRPVPETALEDVVPVAHVVKPATVMTRQQAREDQELTERMERVAALLIVTCPDCGAGEAELCSFRTVTLNNPHGAPATLLDRERHIIVHDSRIGVSVREHIAKVTDVVAQYNDQVPESVWRYAV